MHEVNEEENKDKLIKYNEAETKTQEEDAEDEEAEKVNEENEAEMLTVKRAGEAKENTAEKDMEKLSKFIENNQRGGIKNVEEKLKR